MIHSFLLIGQSNMAGRGFLSEAHDIDNSHIYKLVNGRWQRMFRPVCHDRETSGVCLAESFAEQYAKDNNVDVGLIPCADGGTTISQWMPGQPLYDNAVFNAKLAMRQSTLAGILWHQGESDCSNTNDTTATYKQNLKILIASLNKDLSLNNVPFIAGALGDFMGKFHSNDKYLLINKAFEEIASEQDTVGYALASGLKPNADLLHLSSDALYEFGLRYYDVFKKLNKRQSNQNDNSANLERSEMELL